jgi:hypothetical protein
MKKLIIALLIVSTNLLAVDKEYTLGTNNFVSSVCTPPTHRELDIDGIAKTLTLEELAYTTILYSKDTLFTSNVIEKQGSIRCEHNEPISSFSIGLWNIVATVTDTQNRKSVNSNVKTFNVLPSVLPPTEGERVTQGLVSYYPMVMGRGTTVYDVAGATNLSLTGDVSWIPGTNGLQFTTGRAGAAGLNIITALKQTNAYSIETWIIPANITQTGPARIITISQDPTYQNLLLGQHFDNLSLRLGKKTGGTSNYTTGSPLSTTLTHIIYTFNGTDLKVYVNKVLAGTFLASSTGSPYVLADLWRDTDIFSLGNENNPSNVPEDDRPFAGTIKLAAVYNRVLTQAEIDVNYNFGAETAIIMPPKAPINLNFN